MSVIFAIANAILLVPSLILLQRTSATASAVASTTAYAELTDEGADPNAEPHTRMAPSASSNKPAPRAFQPPDFGPTTQELEEKALTESAKLGDTAKPWTPQRRHITSPTGGMHSPKGVDSPTAAAPIHTAVHTANAVSLDDKVDALRPHRPGWSTEQIKEAIGQSGGDVNAAISAAIEEERWRNLR